MIYSLKKHLFEFQMSVFDGLSDCEKNKFKKLKQYISTFELTDFDTLSETEEMVIDEAFFKNVEE